MSEHKDNIIHVYDGIEEADNRLPLWWLWTLFGTVIFGAFYWFWAESFHIGKHPSEQLAVDRADRERIENEKLNLSGPFTPDKLVEMAQNPKIVEAGKSLFVANCSPCHGPNAASAAANLGPNLTDEYWIHGGAPDTIIKTIREGVLPKGMPPWLAPNGAFRELQVRQVAAYVVSVKGTNLAGKPPQGNKE